MQRIIVLMSTYNGKQYFAEQVESILNQEGVDFSILIRDDGSTDHEFIEMLKHYESNDKINIIYGENVGYAKSFWELVNIANDADYYAFSDQDDVWDKNKMVSGVNILENNDEEKPLLYCCNVRVVDKSLKYIRNFIDEEKPKHYINACLKGFAPGCGFIFNRSAIGKLKIYKGQIDIHDMMIMRILQGIGLVYFDPVPKMSYRQHENNLIGARAKIKKDYVGHYLEIIKIILRKIFRKKVHGQAKKSIKISGIANNMLDCYRNDLNSENRALLEYISGYKANNIYRKKLLKCIKDNFNGNKKLIKLLINSNRL